MNSMSQQIMFTRADLARFKREYQRARDRANGDEHKTFVFDGNEWVIGYAKYAIEYLEMKLPDQTRPDEKGKL